MSVPVTSLSASEQAEKPSRRDVLSQGDEGVAIAFGNELALARRRAN